MSTPIADPNENFNYERDRPSSQLISSKEPSVENESLFEKLKKVTSISEVLRLFGACAVIASMSLFLLNGWSDGNDIQRYLKLLGQTGLLTAAGLILSFALKENKGARIFFGLSLISVVANFMILGALTYSMFQLDGSLMQYPSMVTWKAVNASTFWPIFGVAVTLLSVLTRFSFSVFARNISGPLSISFLLLCSLLLVPVRSSIIASLLAVAALWFAVLVVKKLSKNEKVVFTNETKFALGLLFAPSFLIIARALSLYNVDEVMLITLSGLTYVALRSWIVGFTQPSFVQKVVEKFQFAVAVHLAVQLVLLLPNALSDISVAIFSILALALTYDQIKATNDTKWQKGIATVTIVALSGINIVNAFQHSSIILQASSLIICFGLLWFTSFIEPLSGENGDRKLISVIGIISCGLIIANQAVAYIQLGNWAVIGLIGATMIVGGSLFERYGMSLFSSSKKSD